MHARVLLISPVRNEAAHIERVVRAVAAQELPPERWIVIDDTSTDGTLEILRSLAPDVPFMEVLRRARRPHAGARDRLAERPHRGTSMPRSPLTTGASTPTS